MHNETLNPSLKVRGRRKKIILTATAHPSACYLCRGSGVVSSHLKHGLHRVRPEEK